MECHFTPSPLEKLYGLPISPPAPYWPALPDVLHWGAPHLPWGPVIFGDGSGFDKDVPELFKRGWAIVELDDNLWPVRALYGAFPGPLQSVGRAERWAVLQALLHCEGMTEYVADLWGLVAEGREWGARRAAPKGKHAAIWQACFAAQAQRSKPPPAFTWCPAHKAQEQVLEEQLPGQPGSATSGLTSSPRLALASIALTPARSSAAKPMSSAPFSVRSS